MGEGKKSFALKQPHSKKRIGKCAASVCRSQRSLNRLDQQLENQFDRRWEAFDAAPQTKPKTISTPSPPSLLPLPQPFRVN